MLSVQDEERERAATMIKHTPGSWRYDSYGGFVIGSHEHEIVADVYGKNSEERKANICLIMAAPTMLGLLQRLVNGDSPLNIAAEAEALLEKLEGGE
jgi:hypothetical protein